MKLNQYEWDPENDKLGEGAFAEVFRTKDIYANRYVALKIYKTSVKASTLGNTGQVKYSMEQEFQNVESVSHTNIIKYYGLNYIKHVDAMGREGNYPVIIMEYANEGTLTEFLKQNPDRSVLDKLIRDLIMGVGHLHEEGLLHRDLKPGIILVTKNKKGIPTAKITDFGISKDTLSSESHTTSHTEMIGTPHYMVSEQIYQKKFGLEGRISQRTDLWAIGAIIYKMFTHRVPFADGTQDLELVREGITTGEYDLTGVPMTYHALLAQCFKKNASERIASADQMLKLIGKTDNTMTRQDDKDMEATVIRPRKIESLQKKEDVKGTLDTLYSKKEKDDKRPIDIASVLSKLQKIVLVAYVVINTLFPQSLYNHLLCTVTFVT